MIRWWPYLNQINKVSLMTNNRKTEGFLNSYQYWTFKTTTYYWDELYSNELTFLKRHCYFRRKHLNNWLVYQNVLNSWAKDYLFTRRYSKAIMSLSIHKNNYIYHNLVVQSSLDMSNHVGFEQVSVSFFINKVINFCSKFNTVFYAKTFNFKGSIFYTSSYLPWKDLDLKKKLKEDFSYQIYGGGLSNRILGRSRVKGLELLLAFLLNYNVTYCVSLYKILIFKKLLSCFVFKEVKD